MPLKFHSPTKGCLDFYEVAEEVMVYVKVQPKSSYSLLIGTDSRRHSPQVDYVSVIVIYRHGLGGRYFWTREKRKTGPALRDQIYQETLISIDLAKKLLNTISEKILSLYNIEIHIDVGQNGPTKDIIREVVGMVKGYGFNAKTKPEACAASTVADRHT